VVYADRCSRGTMRMPCDAPNPGNTDGQATPGEPWLGDDQHADGGIPVRWLWSNMHEGSPGLQTSPTHHARGQRKLRGGRGLSVRGPPLFSGSGLGLGDVAEQCVDCGPAQADSAGDACDFLTIGVHASNCRCLLARDVGGGQELSHSGGQN
jgi:hypothetical protein